jgi:hypothetical protein
MTMAVSVSTFFWKPMGNSLDAYRSVIGMFYYCSRISCKCVLVSADSHRNILLILCILILHKEVELSLELLSKLGGELDRSISGPGFSSTLLIIKMKWRTYFFVHCSSPFSSVLYICFILTCTYTCVFVDARRLLLYDI